MFFSPLKDIPNRKGAGIRGRRRDDKICGIFCVPTRCFWKVILSKSFSDGQPTACLTKWVHILGLGVCVCECVHVITTWISSLHSLALLELPMTHSPFLFYLLLSFGLDKWRGQKATVPPAHGYSLITPFLLCPKPFPCAWFLVCVCVCVSEEESVSLVVLLQLRTLSANSVAPARGPRHPDSNLLSCAGHPFTPELPEG